MKNPKKIAALLFLLFALLCTLGTAAYSYSAPSVSARAAVLYEPSSKLFVYEKLADVRLPMASTTKIMTALVAIEKGDLDAYVRIAPEAVGTEGSSMYLSANEKMTLRDLVYGLMLRSANDAAVAIAYAVAQDIDTFAALMNEKAAELGLANTHFTNPHGLDDKEHYTTARELALISAAALDNAELRTICKTKRYTVKNTDGTARLLINHNKLLSLYEGAIGVKTGFTKRSGRCLVGAAEKSGITLISVTIDAPDDWSDHKKMLDAGFSALESRVLAQAGEISYKLPVLDKTISYIEVKNTSVISAVIPKEGADISYTVELPRTLATPIRKGDVIGKVTYRIDNKVIATAPLVATQDALPQRRGILSLF